MTADGQNAHSAARVRLKCPGCDVKIERPLTNPMPEGFSCSRCACGIPLYGRPGASSLPVITSCIVCRNPTFYMEKDFPHALGFLILGIGAVLSFWTYGLSLPVFGLADWLLYRSLPKVKICYLCLAGYRGISVEEEVKAYDPHTGMAYDARRAQPYLPAGAADRYMHGH